MPRELLGSVTAPSGILLLIDTGMLELWSHNRQPVIPDGILRTPEATDFANRALDYRMIGADAIRAGVQLDWSWHPEYAYDQPSPTGKIFARLAEIVAELGLDARLEPLPERIPHRRRVDLALEYGGGAGVVQYHGLSAVTVAGVPRSEQLAVWGERSDDGCYWSEVIVECRPGRVVQSLGVGVVAVDRARILVADVDALGEWQHEEPLDGLADYVFWGRDAAQAARAFEAPQVEPDQFGWVDLPVRVAAERGMAVEDYCQVNELLFAGDFRPHSHHWLIMRETRASPTESGTIEVGGAALCNFMASVGDGFFPVSLDLDENGILMRIRITICPKDEE